MFKHCEGENCSDGTCEKCTKGFIQIIIGLIVGLAVGAYGGYLYGMGVGEKTIIDQVDTEAQEQILENANPFTEEETIVNPFGGDGAVEYQNPFESAGNPFSN